MSLWVGRPCGHTVPSSLSSQGGTQKGRWLYIYYTIARYRRHRDEDDDDDDGDDGDGDIREGKG